MQKFLESLTPEDVLAFIVVIGCLTIKMYGKGEGTDNIITGVISYRLGRHAQTNVQQSSKQLNAK